MTTTSYSNERRRRNRPTKNRDHQKKTKLDSVSLLKQELAEGRFSPGLSDDSYQNIINAKFRGKNLALACVVSGILLDENPITLRGAFYRVVSAGSLPSTDKQHYNRLGRITKRLREAGLIPFSWIVDNLRSTVKPSSWSGMSSFIETVKNAYRLDFWASLDEYVHVFCEKDAIAGVLSPVTTEYDVALSPIRGYCSLSFAHDIAVLWNGIEKPIHAYYLGDFDPSGFDLERDVKEKLQKYCDREFEWTRLAVIPRDFEAFNLIPLKPKRSDKRYRSFVDCHGSQCAELDAIPPTELRRRIREAIESHIPMDRWEKLKTVEQAEKQSFENFMQLMPVRGTR